MLSCTPAAATVRQRAMASRMSSRPARRAGSQAAATPASAATTTTTTIGTTGTESPEANDAGRAATTPKPKSRPSPTPRRGAERGDQCRLEAHHPAQLAAGHANRPNQAELTGALEHRQGQRVGDADQGDHHGQRDHHVHHRQDLVDHALDPLAELVGGLDRRVRVLVGQSGDQRIDVGREQRRRRSRRPATRRRVDADVGEHARCRTGSPRSGSAWSSNRPTIVVIDARDRWRLDGDRVAEPGADRLRLVDATRPPGGDGGVEAAGLDVEVEHGVDLIEVEADDVGDRAVDAGVEVA